MILLAPKKDRRTGMLLAFVTAFVVTLYPVYLGALPYDFDYSSDSENDDPFTGGCIYMHVDNEFPGWALNCTEGPPLANQAVFPDQCLDERNLKETSRSNGGVSACSGDYDTKIISCDELCGQREERGVKLQGRCVEDNYRCKHPKMPFGESVATSACQCGETYGFEAGDSGPDPFKPGWIYQFYGAFGCFNNDPSEIMAVDTCYGTPVDERRSKIVRWLVEYFAPEGCFKGDDLIVIDSKPVVCGEACKKRGFSDGTCEEVEKKIFLDKGDWGRRFTYERVGYCQCQDNNGNPVPPEMIPPEGTSSPRPPAADNSISMDKSESTLCSTSGSGDLRCPSSPAADPSLNSVYEIEQIS